MSHTRTAKNCCSICAELIGEGSATLKELTDYYDAEDMLVIYEAIAVKRYNEYQATKNTK